MDNPKTNRFGCILHFLSGSGRYQAFTSNETAEDSVRAHAQAIKALQVVHPNSQILLVSITSLDAEPSHREDTPSAH